jgi:hypothetical protein
MTGVIVKRASASGSARPARNADDFDGLAEGVAVGRIFKANAAPGGMPWIWTLAFGRHEDRTPTHGYAESRGPTMTPFAKSWRREWNEDAPPSGIANGQSHCTTPLRAAPKSYGVC